MRGAAGLAASVRRRAGRGSMVQSTGVWVGFAAGGLERRARRVGVPDSAGGAREATRHRSCRTASGPRLFGRRSRPA